jgi:hypothetical protein
MEANIVEKSLIVTVHTMRFIERRQFQEHHKKMVRQKGQTSLYHGACKEHEITCMIALIVLGRHYRYCCLLDK